MFKKLLIANRGEVALRIMRAARELGVATVAVYSTEDADTYPVRYADEAICIGPAPADNSYLFADSIIEAARITGAEAIHPGYGFLAEDPDFARACADAGIAFVGPSADCIERMCDGAAARGMMKACGVPIVPGSDDIVVNAERARDIAQRLGYPVLVKPTIGDGGTGVREVFEPADIEAAYEEARAQAGQAFGSDNVYIEKLISSPRMIEIQVLADGFNNRVALCECDCSVQRRGHRLIDEVPSPAVNEDLRRAMSVAAVKAVRAVDYRGVASVEFLLTRDGRFYFVDMHTCLQPEHAVVEQIAGVDIVKEQLRIAAGEPMSCAERAPFWPTGHAVEFRIEAEDPYTGYRPHGGTITRFEVPSGPGVRVETHASAGSRVAPHYESLLAKLIVYGQDREEALARGRRALDEFIIEGVQTTLPFHRRVLDNAVFCGGETTTDFIETQMGDLL